MFPSTISTKKGGKNKKRSKKKKKRTDTPFESSDVLLTAGAFGSAVSMREAACPVGVHTSILEHLHADHGMSQAAVYNEVIVSDVGARERQEAKITPPTIFKHGESASVSDDMLQSPAAAQRPLEHDLS